MTRNQMARALAPVAPPCFDSRMQWLEYCDSAAVDHSNTFSGPLKFEKGVIRIEPEMNATATPVGQPLLFEKGKTVSFNPNFDFCSECDPAWSATKRREGTCRPTYLRDLLAPTKESTS